MFASSNKLLSEDICLCTHKFRAQVLLHDLFVCLTFLRVCVCVCVRVRACARACACVGVGACVHVPLCLYMHLPVFASRLFVWRAGWLSGGLPSGCMYICSIVSMYRQVGIGIWVGIANM